MVEGNGKEDQKQKIEDKKQKNIFLCSPENPKNSTLEAFKAGNHKVTVTNST